MLRCVAVLIVYPDCRLNEMRHCVIVFGRVFTCLLLCIQTLRFVSPILCFRMSLFFIRMKFEIIGSWQFARCCCRFCALCFAYALDARGVCAQSAAIGVCVCVEEKCL